MANYAYDPWGQSIPPVVPPRDLDQLGTKNKYKFTGEATDPVSNLLYLRARFYDPNTGRFLSRDPIPGYITQPITQMRYQYAHCNPITNTDPTGLVVESAQGIVLGAFTTVEENPWWYPWGRRIGIALPKSSRLYVEGLAARGELSASGAATSILVQIPDFAAVFAKSQLEVIRNQAAQIEIYAEDVMTGATSVNTIIEQIYVSNYLPGMTREKIAFLINQEIILRHLVNKGLSPDPE